jgi:small GTP-binding protein
MSTLTSFPHLLQPINPYLSGTALSKFNASPIRRRMKVVLVGDQQVGKTSIIAHLVTNTFNPATSPTIGAAFQTYCMATAHGPVTMQIWDTAGQEKYRALTPLYYRSADVAVLVYDITQVASFHGMERWSHELAEKAPPNLRVVIVGNKSDLIDGREVDAHGARAWAEEHGAKRYAEVSAKTGDGISDLFLGIAEMLSDEKSKESPVNAVKAPDEAPQGAACC